MATKSKTVKSYSITDKYGNTRLSKGFSPLDALKYSVALHWQAKKALIKRASQAESNFTVTDNEKGTKNYYFVMW